MKKFLANYRNCFRGLFYSPFYYAIIVILSLGDLSWERKALEMLIFTLGLPLLTMGFDFLLRKN